MIKLKTLILKKKYIVYENQIAFRPKFCCFKPGNYLATHLPPFFLLVKTILDTEETKY